MPDLLAAPTDDGQIGYVRVSELELARNVAGSLESGERVVDVYASDGETVVGQFTVTKDMPGPRAGMDGTLPRRRAVRADGSVRLVPSSRFQARVRVRPTPTWR